MKFFIWLSLIFVDSLFVETMKEQGVRFGAIPTVIRTGFVIAAATYLCKKWDARKARKNQSRTQSAKNREVFCPSCGTWIGETTNYCPNCGRRAVKQPTSTSNSTQTSSSKPKSKSNTSVTEKVLFRLVIPVLILAILVALYAKYTEDAIEEPVKPTVAPAVTPEPRLKEQPKPFNGEIIKGNGFGDSEIKITASTTEDHVVSLKTADGRLRLAFYVRAGQTTTVNAPAEKLYVYFASGNKWYGYGKGLMFGEDTVYSKDDELLDFSAGGWEYTLHPVSNGNFSETPIDEGEFF